MSKNSGNVLNILHIKVNTYNIVHYLVLSIESILVFNIKILKMYLKVLSKPTLYHFIFLVSKI